MIDVTCRRCGVEWEPSRNDDVRGLWRLCPDYRDDARAQTHDGPTQALSDPYSGSGTADAVDVRDEREGR